jgi:hypothetical protein
LKAYVSERVVCSQINHPELWYFLLQLVKQFIAGRLPVPLSPQEEAYTAAGAPLATIFPYTQLRMLRPGLATAVVEDGKLVVYHCMDNSRCVQTCLPCLLLSDLALIAADSIPVLACGEVRV